MSVITENEGRLEMYDIDPAHPQRPMVLIRTLSAPAGVAYHRAHEEWHIAREIADRPDHNKAQERAAAVAEHVWRTALAAAEAQGVVRQVQGAHPIVEALWDDGAWQTV
jgi:hypothetical protein